MGQASDIQSPAAVEEGAGRPVTYNLPTRSINTIEQLPEPNRAAYTLPFSPEILDIWSGR